MRCKLFIITAILSSLLLGSCKKGSSDTETYVKFKLNGTLVTWNKVIGELGPDLANSSKTNLGVTGNSDDENEVLDISFQVDGTELATGTYNSEDYFMPVSYIKNAKSPSITGYDMTSVDGQPDSHFSVTVTSITEDELRGTFTGNYLSNSGTEEMITITDGEFVVKRIR